MSVYLILAAIVYTTPFLLPYYAWPLLWLLGSFLFAALKSKPLSGSLFYWSFTVWAILLLPITDTLLYMAPNHSALGFIPSTLLILYSTSYTTLWLIFSSYGIKKVQTLLGQLLLWTLSLWLYLLFVERWQFFLLGQVEGNIFASPLLPLAANPALLMPLQELSNTVVLLWFCTISSTITLCWLEPKKIYWALLFCLAIPWGISSLLRPAAKKPTWLNFIGHLPLMLPASTSLYGGAALLSHEINALQTDHPEITTIITPESAWNGSLLGTISKIPFISIPNLLIGSFYEHNTQSYNSLYQFRHGRKASRTDKRHALPLTERPLPWQPENSLYFQKSGPTQAAIHARPLLDLPTIGHATAYICSELFCYHTPNDPFSCLIIAVASDWWVRHPHFAQLMALAARLKAMQWQRPILYISYRYAHFFDQYGHSYPIATTPNQV